MREVMILARWLASKAVKAEWKAMGRKLQYEEASKIAEASNVYFIDHRNELLNEAKAHPVIRHYQHQEQMLKPNLSILPLPILLMQLVELQRVHQ